MTEHSTVPELAASIFVSYTHRDGDIARGVAARLTKLGHRVWIDEGELRLGDSLVDAISGAIAQVDFLVAFVSPGSVESNWCQKEISLAMTGEIGRKGITVIPCGSKT
jgi:predicted nucleotide-binding protein